MFCSLNRAAVCSFHCFSVPVKPFCGDSCISLLVQTQRLPAGETTGPSTPVGSPNPYRGRAVTEAGVGDISIHQCQSHTSRGRGSNCPSPPPNTSPIAVTRGRKASLGHCRPKTDLHTVIYEGQCKNYLYCSEYVNRLRDIASFY